MRGHTIQRDGIVSGWRWLGEEEWRAVGKREGELGCGSLHEAIYSSPVILGSFAVSATLPRPPRPRGQEYHALTPHPRQAQIQLW